MKFLHETCTFLDFLDFVLISDASKYIGHQ